jgi:dethiobiotin synthetase
MAARARGFFIAGTDTGVGKTRIAVDIVRALVREGWRVGVMKPVAAGAEPTSEGLRNTDALELMRASNVSAPYAAVNRYCLPEPASPHIAARMADIEIDRARIVREFQLLSNTTRAQAVVVEGAGGWLAPISPSESMADVAVALGLPVLLVVGLRLGCLNHALLTARAIESSGLTLAGWIANHLQPHFEHADENIALLEQHLRGPLLETVGFNAPAFASATAAGRLKQLC